jgi:hypothetical protein
MQGCFLALLWFIAQHHGVIPATLSEDTHPDAIRRWINQLASPKYAERQAASLALEKVGAAALPALRKAARHTDLETSRRVAALALKIQARQEALHFLTPRRIRLAYTNTPVVDAVADFAERTGWPIQLTGVGATLDERRVSLDTGEVPLWEAFDRLCQASSIKEPPVVPAAVKGLRVTRTANGRRLLQGPPTSAFPLISNDRDERFHLIDGPRARLPTAVTGVVRFRALPVPFDRDAGETGFFLEATPQFKSPWEGVVRVRISHALDDRGQVLQTVEPLALDVSDPSAAWTTYDPATRELLTTLKNPRVLPIRLRAGKQTSHVLKQLSGALTARVPVKRHLLVVDDVLESAGKTIKNDDGACLKVERVTRLLDRGVRFEVAWRPPPLSEAGRLGQVVRIGPGIVAFSGERFLNSANVQVLDARGRPFASIEVDALRGESRDAITSYEITCRPQPEQTEASQLIYVGGLQSAEIDIPFTLDDVPLP